MKRLLKLIVKLVNKLGKILSKKLNEKMHKLPPEEQAEAKMLLNKMNEQIDVMNVESSKLDDKKLLKE